PEQHLRHVLLREARLSAPGRIFQALVPAGVLMREVCAWRRTGMSIAIACFAMLAARSHAAQGNITRGCAGRFDPAHDYFPDKAMVEDAANFAIEYHQSYKLL